MPAEISIPFRLDANRQIAVDTLPNRQIRMHVLSLINTEPGERVVIDAYGVALNDSIFNGSDEQVANDVADDIQAAFSRWEPGIVLRSVAHVPSQLGDGLATVDVQYARSDAPDTPEAGRRTNRAFISASGTVTEEVRA